MSREGMPELRPLKSPPQRSCVAVCPDDTQPCGVAPNPGHPWSQACHDLCTDLSSYPIVAFPDSLHADQIVYREKEECELNHKNHLLPEFREFPGTSTWGAISRAYSPCMVSCGLTYTVFLTGGILNNTEEQQQKAQCKQLRTMKDEEKVLHAKGYHSNWELSHILKGSETGSVVTARSLDRETKDTHVLKPEYRESIRENLEVGYEVLTIRATDGDAPANANMLYRLLEPGAGDGVFEIDPRSGVVRTRAPVDREEVSEYHLVVEANDQEDENDNYPQFSEKRYLVQVPEDAPVNSQILQVQATDRDRGSNAQVHYSIVSGNLKGQFYIHSFSGAIDLINPLDYETIREYTLRIKAQDGGRPPLINSSGMVSVQATVLENVPLGYSVLHIQAVDADSGENARLEYKLIEMAPSTGELDRETVENYHFGVEARDHGVPVMTSSASVSITVLDVNDNNPTFTEKITSGNTRNRFAITITASDGTRFDTVQVFINVTDANTHRPVFQSSHYTFRIDPDTGTITTLMELDYEDQASYTLAITAHDNGIPQKSDTTYVEILILDANDNAPRFLRDRYQGSVFEDVPLSTSVLQLSATDRDSGLNGRLLYTFQGGDDGDGDFYIEPTSGVIRTLRKLDRENVAVYSLRAFAVDRGSPPLKASVDIQVTVLDINDNPPVFEKDEFDIFVEENSPVGSIVARISAADPDEGTNAQIMYQIVEGNIPEVFQLDLLNGDLTALMDLDYESRTEYVIVVQATSAPLVSRATVHIRLLDQNDNPPVLQDFQILFNNYVTNKSNSFPSGVIGKIPAHDPDVSDSLAYTFVQGNELNLLLLDSATGELKLSRDLDNNRPLEALMKVSVSVCRDDRLASNYQHVAARRLDPVAFPAMCSLTLQVGVLAQGKGQGLSLPGMPREVLLVNR
ncbi:cadherin egf lag seven-pass g-type receptor 1 isoform x4 [Limosa lapponica baueri]|uniref:Cadherin egf lag seven-pass g-type receptor 1 isoform x4 n=1 Tax=Limosa lapponica baueri TaxID=1758121 RepID=A0A2I0UBZ3_LIMLA|nr:cadherin egf lag seven-pass g-type receptor 1 isoform x4 [Limosa lapponica baueri]